MKLGINQKIALRAVRQNCGRFYFGCGRDIGTQSSARKILASLVRKGLLVHFSEPYARINLHGADRAWREIWMLTPAGHAAA